MHLSSLTNAQLRDRTLALAARLRTFQEGADEGRNDLIDTTLPGWSHEEQGRAFRRITSSLQRHHEETQSDFRTGFMSDALALRQELMSRLGIASPLEGGDNLEPLRYDAADYLEELARSLPD
jgi:hypothetical protein